jgi:ribonuclease E
MAKKMLINALHAEEARVAIVEDGRLVDLDVEIAGNEQIRGNIYRGVVVRVEPGLQAAFVDIGLKKLGFLQMGEIHPENYRWRDDIPEDQRHRRPRIQEILRRGQELIVQVEKGERDNKGSALTTYASLPGRYMVLMPGSDSAGISRKVEAEGERKKLKEIISEMQIPEGYGYIIRTEAMGRTRDELQRDLDSLIHLYEGVRAKGAEMKGAGLIYQESALIIRTIRDYFSADIDEVLVDSKDVFKDVRECLKEIDPNFEKLVKMHQEKRPIFSRYQLEEQIDLIYEKKVPLKSGGSIFIEPTEALVSIDVNSGKSTGEKGVEDTAFKTNLEAAEEAARQLRLRDLGGLIVIDFIDMRDRKHNAEVEKTLKTALKADKARVNVARISEFGLLEMSRQRIRQTLNQASTLECPHCDGRGKVKSVEAMALSFLRKVHAAAAKGTTAEVIGSLPLEVAYYLLNRKRQELSRIEMDYDIEVTVKGKPSYLLNQMELELVKREKLPQEELPQEKGIVRGGAVAAKEEAPHEAADGRKKKKRGKGKAQTEGVVAEAPAIREEGVSLEAEAAAHAPESPAFPQEMPAAPGSLEGEPIAEGAEAVALAVEPGGAERVIVAEGEHEEHKKKRRRKRRRGKGAAAEAAAAEHGAEHEAEHGAVEPVEVAVDLPAPAEGAEAGVAEHPAEGGGELHGDEVRKKRRRRRRRGKGHEAAAHEGAEQHVGGVSIQESVMASEGLPVEAAHGAEAATASGTPAIEAPAVASASEAGDAAGPAVEPSPEEEKVKKARRPRKKGKPAEAPAAEGAAPAELPVAVAATAAPEATVAQEEGPRHQGAELREEPAAEAPAPAKAKRGRGKKPAAEGAAVEAGTVPAPVVAGEKFPAEAAGSEEAAAPEAAAPAKPERGAGKRGRKPRGAGEEGVFATAASEPIPSVTALPSAIEPVAAPAPAPEAPVVQGPAAGEAVVGGAEPVAAPPKKRAPRRQSATAGEAGTAAAEAAAEKPKKPRAPRKKKEETPAGDKENP